MREIKIDDLKGVVGGADVGGSASYITLSKGGQFFLNGKLMQFQTPSHVPSTPDLL